MRLVSLFLGVGISVIASLAYAGWSNNPVQISTSGSIPLVEGCNDSAHGTFVAWQDGALLRVQHLLPSGDPDPAWPAAGAIACNVAADRTDLALLPDGLGGLYVSWIETSIAEPQALYLTRLDESGQTAPGWPARGRGFGPASFPTLLADDAHGLFMAWTGQSTAPPAAVSLLMIHLGPDNGESSGWTGGAHAVRPSDPAGSVDLMPALAPDGSGGAHVAWVRISPNEALVPSAACLLRLSPDGQSANGWPEMGLAFTPFAWDFSSDPSRFVIDVATDGHGGAFLLVGEPLPQTYPDLPRVDVRLRRLTSDGDPAPGWTEEGRLIQSSLDVLSPHAVPEVLYNGLDDAVVAIPSYYSEGYTEMVYRRNPDTGSPVVIGLATPIAGRELVSNDQGGFFAATFNPVGPYSNWAPYAHIRLAQFAAPVGWQDFWEVYTNPVLDIYGDIGLAKTGDGGAVLFWSQKYDRIGLFARRFGPQGETLDAGTSNATFGIQSVRFQPGSGVMVRFSSATGGLARLGLFDVTGRRMAAVDASLSAGGEVAIPGTGGLRTGLYFVRLTAGNAASNARITVLR